MVRHVADLPSSPGLPLFGNALSFARDPLGSLTGSARQHGDLVHTKLGPVHMVLVSDPALIEHLLVRLKNDVGKDRVTQALSIVMGQGLLTAEGETWRRNRRLAAPSFQRNHIQAYAKAFVEVARQWVDGLPDRSRRDLHADFTNVTLQIVVRTLFGVAQAPDSGLVGQLVDTVMDELTKEIFTIRKFLPMRVPTPGRLRMRAAAQKLDSLLQPLVDDRRRTGATGDDLLSRLVDARDEDGSAFSDQQLRDEVVTAFLAGHETTALALSYSVWLLGQNPDAAARQYAEVRAACPAGDPSLASLEHLPYTRAVVQEALRLYPPAWVVGRELLHEVEFGGVRIPAGWELTASQWVVHRDPRWYKSPDAFRPDRWLTGELDKNHRYAYFPFGGGPRVCIGQHFAMMEAVLVLATITRHLDLRGVPGTPLAVDPSITLRPRDGVWLDVARRSPETS